jgi:hypothetical protein
MLDKATIEQQIKNCQDTVQSVILQRPDGYNQMELLWVNIAQGGVSCDAIFQVETHKENIWYHVSATVDGIVELTNTESIPPIEPTRCVPIKNLPSISFEQAIELLVAAGCTNNWKLCQLLSPADNPHTVEYCFGYLMPNNSYIWIHLNSVTKHVFLNPLH